jgi:hypothetical protein
MVMTLGGNIKIPGTLGGGVRAPAVGLSFRPCFISKSDSSWYCVLMLNFPTILYYITSQTNIITIDLFFLVYLFCLSSSEFPHPH